MTANERFRRLRRMVRDHRNALVVAAVALLAAGFVVLLWRGAPLLDAGRLHVLTPVQRESAIDAIRGRLLQLAAGIVLTVGLVYTGLTFRLNRESHVTDRYTKAIDQLGSERLDVRLGAIYALERVMIDSERDHPTIVEVLAAYVREHAPLPEETASGDGVQSNLTRLKGPTTDVQAAVSVLGRRPSGRAERGFLDLQRTRLSGAILTDANLAGADLTGVDLSGAELSCAGLAGADLRGADLRRAVLIRANLTHALLMGADLTQAIMDGAQLTHANMMVVNLTRANLADVTLDSANLVDANLTLSNGARANLVWANLRGADLTDAKWATADLTNADLTGADLTDAHLPPGLRPDTGEPRSPAAADT